MTARERLDAMMRKYSPEIAAVARGALPRMRRQLRGAYELVFDNYNALVIGYAPGEKTSEAFCSIALYPRWVNLFFLHGASLPDPERLLRGSGKQVRSVRLESARTLDAPAVVALLSAAADRAGLAPGPRRPTVVKSVVKKQRPLRPR